MLLLLGKAFKLVANEGLNVAVFKEIGDEGVDGAFKVVVSVEIMLASVLKLVRV